MKQQKMSFILSLLLIALLAVLVFFYKSGYLVKSTESTTISTNEKATDFLEMYKKLNNKSDIQILVVGDSIGESDGVPYDKAWFTQLSNWLKTKYGVNVNIKLVTHPGGGIKDGLKEYTNNLTGYDLVYLCYGQNDRTMDKKQWLTSYENLINHIRKNNNTADIVLIIESSFQNYEDIPNQIKIAAEKNNLSYVDTRVNFKNTGIQYKNLTVDGIHPNYEGYKLYFNALSKLIDEKYKKIQ